MDSHISFGSVRFKFIFNSPSYVLTLLWCVALLRMVDMQIIAVLLESIKAEFSISDTQLGLLSGLSFALLYSFLGIPVASFADRYNRVFIISVALACWSIMTILCGQAIGFISLFIARMGVGVGESGAYAPSASLLWDYTKPGNRNRSFAVLASAIPAGVFVSFLLGSYVSDHYGWRAVFYFVGVPGLLLSALMMFTLSDNRIVPLGIKQNLFWKGTIKQVKELIENRRYLNLILAACFSTLGATGSGIWMPSFYMRSHGTTIVETGIIMALLYGVGGLLGTALGGIFSDKLNKNTQSIMKGIKLCGYSVTLTLPVLALVFTSQDLFIVIVMHFVFVVLLHINIAPVLAGIQVLANDANRAVAQALNVLMSSLIGIGLGSVFIGGLSDALLPFLGISSLAYSILIIVAFAYLLAGMFYFSCANLLKNKMKLAWV